MSSFSDNLVYLRQRNGMSQQDLADRSGCSRSAIGMYETGKREPDIETLEAFADIFNVDMDFLTGRVESSEWSIRFRQKLSELLEICNPTDIEATGLNVDDLRLVASGTSKLTFDFACDIADAFGVSFDFMLSRESENAPTITGERKDLIDIIPHLPDDIVHALLALAKQAEQRQ